MKSRRRGKLHVADVDGSVVEDEAGSAKLTLKYCFFNLTVPRFSTPMGILVASADQFP
ncbi:MAG TPA: hypothetical protein VMJ32_14170 [Pirellulales bacterium]|nr:hypothetical protein [Pirellulales bacterium]